MKSLGHLDTMGLVITSLSNDDESIFGGKIITSPHPDV